MSRQAGEGAHFGATSGADSDPIIATLQFDAASAAFFERQRRSYFPPALNRIPAHLTLFHKLPGEDADFVLRALGGRVAGEPFPVAVEGLMLLGRGVAYRIVSDQLVRMRAGLAEPFAGRLSGQDRSGFRPHVTVQNKVTKEEARATFEALSAGFVPFTARAEGVQLWRYRGGPWEALAALGFGAGRVGG